MDSGGATTVNINALLKKTEHYDKDERYMATSDLCEMLKRSTAGTAGGPGAMDIGGGGGMIGMSMSSSSGPTSSLDANTERQICTAVLRLLHDKSNDVQAIAVKTLGVLLTTVQQEQVLEIADSLADQVLDASKSELRDVYAIGLRTLVKTVPASMGNKVSQRLVGRLLDGIRNTSTSAGSTATMSGSGTGNEDIVLACMDSLTDLLQRFGGTALAVTRQHEPILQTCLKQLGSEHAVVRKRAGNTLGCLSVVLSDALLLRMVESLLGQMDLAQQKVGQKRGGGIVAGGVETTSDTRAVIRTMCTVSGAVGHRLGQAQIDRILPIFLRFTEPEDAITGDDDDDDHDDDAPARGSHDEVMTDDDDYPGIGRSGTTDDEAATTLANELRESCFMGFESFVLRCPKEVEPHMDKIIQAALAYMSYDPNYSYGVDEDQHQHGDSEDEDFDDDEDNEYEDEEEDDMDDDDDDESWKVRRSAIRALKAVVEAKKHDPLNLWQHAYTIRRGKKSNVASALVGRFKEREENCRVGVLDCFTRLLAVTVSASQTGVVSFGSPEHDMDTTSNECASSAVIDLRTAYAPKLVASCEKILSVKKGNERSKSSALALLATLCQAPGGVGGQDEIASVFKHVKPFLSASTASDLGLHREGTSKALRLDALSLVHAMLSSDKHDPVSVRKSLRQTLLPELCQAVKEQWYKVIAEALRALAAVPRFFVIGYEPTDDPAMKRSEGAEVAHALYTAIEPLLAAHDVDQEIKECALKACASLLSSLHSCMPVENQQRLLLLLLERLKNETTRIAAIKTLSAIAASPEKVNLTPILNESILTMASFLKLQSRSLKQSSLEALDIVITNHGADPELANGVLYGSVLQDFANLIVDSDLHLSHLSLRATVSVLQSCPSAGPSVKEHTLQHALILSTSSLLQDLALDSLLAFFKQLVLSNAVDFQELLSMLRQRLNNKVSKNGISILAKCIAIITATTNPENCKQVLSEVLALLEGAGTPSEADKLRQVQLALLLTGDLGRMIDLGTLDGAAERLKTIYVSYFDSSSEDLKHAAAYALGNASVGAQATFLPAIVSKLDEENKKQQYLLLSSLREFIRCSFQQSGGDSIAASLPVIVPPLEKHFADEEEGVRTMVAECMGSLTALQPSVMLPKLSELQSNHSNIVAPEGTIAEDDTVSKKNALVCWTVATSVKLAIAGKVDASQLSSFMPQFVKLLEQKELNVRNAALLMVYAAAHHMPQVVAPLLKDSVMPSLYEVADLKLERKVDLGPFTHKVDDALPLRKAALSIFATCLDNAPGSLDITSFMPVLAKALADAEDIQLHAHQIVISVCARHPTYLVASVETFVEPLGKTLNKKAGQKTGTELERLNDWIKSALRVTLSLSKLEGTMNSRVFADFVNRVKSDSKFSGMIETLGEES